MKHYLKTFLVIFIISFCVACNERQIKKDRFTITGQVTGLPNGTKLYLTNLATDAVFDSAIVENDHFKFQISRKARRSPRTNLAKHDGWQKVYLYQPAHRQ